jgi:hypothetical protein
LRWWRGDAWFRARALDGFAAITVISARNFTPELQSIEWQTECYRRQAIANFEWLPAGRFLQDCWIFREPCDEQRQTTAQ